MNDPELAVTDARIELERVTGSRELTAWQRLLGSQELWITLAVLALGLGVAQMSPQFATMGNLGNVFQNFCFIALLAIGMTPIIASGGIDISIGSTLGLCGVVLGLLLHADWPLWLGVAATLLLGALVGLVNGVIIAYLKLPPFIVTLAMLSGVRSLTLVVSGNQVVYTFGQAEQTLLLLGGKTYGVAHVLGAVLVCGVVLHFLLTMTRWGRYVQAIGGNEEAARLTGLPVDLIKVSAYMFGGLMAAICALFLVGWLGSVTNALGTGEELRVIAATVIGGASLSGGAGSAYGALIGSLLIETIRNALLLAGVNPFWQGAFVCVFILFAVLLQRLRALRRI